MLSSLLDTDAGAPCHGRVASVPVTPAAQINALSSLQLRLHPFLVAAYAAFRIHPPKRATGPKDLYISGYR